MAKFDAQSLSDLRDVQEVRIRTEKHPKSAVVIWVVVADDEVFVRSWRGAKGRWYRDLAAGGVAALEFSGRPVPRAAPRGAATGTSRRAGSPPWSLPAAGWRCRLSRLATKMRLPGSATNSCG